MSGVKHHVRERVKNAGARQPAIKDPAQAIPIGRPFLTAPTYGMPPQLKKAIPKHTQAGRIARNGVIPIVASDDRLEPFPGFHNRLMHPQPKLLFQRLQLRPHPLLLSARSPAQRRLRIAQLLHLHALPSSAMPPPRDREHSADRYLPVAAIFPLWRPYLTLLPLPILGHSGL
jgi:hypothetical protein